MKFFLLASVILFLLSACNKVDDIINSDQYDPPEIEAIGASHSNANPGDTVMVWVRATNPEEGLMTYSWQGTGGKYIEPADKDTVFWIAPLAGGNYELKVTVSNEKKNKSATKIVNVISAQKPLVNILSPAAGAFFVQGQEIEVHAEAYHDNGLQQVELFVNDRLAAQQDYRSDNNYQFSFNSDTIRVGQVWIKVQAQVFDQPQNVNADSITVFIEGILPKTGGN